jgi:hypothetical protein
MEYKTGGSLIRLFMGMNAIAKPLTIAFHLPRWSLPPLSGATRRRRQATIDLIHSSPHLLRDIGATEHNVTSRGR